MEKQTKSLSTESQVTRIKSVLGEDVADILNELLGTEYTESKFRKQRQAFDKMLAANRNKFVNDSAQLEEIRLAQRELERSKIQFRDERGLGRNRIIWIVVSMK